MSFALLVLIGLVALLGPLLTVPQRLRMPVMLGELLGGILIGASGFGLVSAANPTFTFLANLGFALTMFVAGSHVPARDARLRPALLGGFLRAIAIGVLAAGAGVALAAVFHTGHGAIYAVLMASSSAALVLPAVDDLGLGGPKVLLTLAQVAIADTVCIVALPLVIDPAHAPTAALGALLIAAGAVVLFFLLRWLDKRGLWHRFRQESHKRNLALELRVSLIVLFSLAALAVSTHVSIMLAGFACGLAVAGVGEPRRLARQLFALNDGFLGPLFYVWLGASLSLGQLWAHPQFIALGIALGVGAIVVHALMRFAKQPVSLGVIAASQLGVPIAAATIGQLEGILLPGEPSALILGALVTIAGLAIASGRAVRGGFVVPASGSAPTTGPTPTIGSASAPGAE